MYRDALATQRKLLGSDHPDIALSLAKFARFLNQRGQFRDAQEMAVECLKLREQRSPNHWRTYATRGLLGVTLFNQKQYSEAEPLLLSAFTNMQAQLDQIPPKERAEIRQTVEKLVELYHQTNRGEQAEEWEKKLADFERSTSTNSTQRTP